MEETERDIVVFNDDEGNEIELEVLDYFDYEGSEYAVMFDPNAEIEDAEDAEQDIFIFKVVEDGEYEEFLPADEDKLEVLSAIVEARLACDEESCEGCSGCNGSEPKAD